MIRQGSGDASRIRSASRCERPVRLAPEQRRVVLDSSPRRMSRHRSRRRGLRRMPRAHRSGDLADVERLLGRGSSTTTRPACARRQADRGSWRCCWRCRSAGSRTARRGRRPQARPCAPSRRRPPRREGRPDLAEGLLPAPLRRPVPDLVSGLGQEGDERRRILAAAGGRVVDERDLHGRALWQVGGPTNRCASWSPTTTASTVPGSRCWRGSPPRFGDVRVVAPDVEQSSASHAITASRPLSYRPRRTSRASRRTG